MKGKFTKFRTRTGGYNMKRPVQACGCGWYTQEGKQRACGACGSEILLTFDSKVEFLRYAELRLLEKHGRIRGLVHHKRFAISVATMSGKPVKGTTYVADFYYRDANDIEVIEDVKPICKPTPKDPKGERALDPVFKLKRRLFEAAYGIPITIIAR